MTRTWTTRLAWGLWAFMAALLVCRVTMQVAWGLMPTDQTVSGAASMAAVAVVFGTVGALLAWRVPATPIGWMFLAVGVLGSGIVDTSGELAYQGLVAEPGSIPGAIVAAWLYSWVWYPLLLLIGMVPLFFPDAKLPTRWRRITGAILVTSFLLLPLIMFNPGPLDGRDAQLPDNPLGIDALGELPGGDLLVAMSFLLVFAGGAVSAIARFRRSRGDERLQLKWMAFSAVGVVVLLFLPSFVGLGSSDVVFAAVVALLPVSLGVAILRYRLYEIDRIISKTLVYGALTVVLGATYIGLVLAGQALFASFAGGSNLAIAVSTLAVAALFLPVRSRVQRFVDRRFYRRRYDAQRTLEGFGARLREQVELETLSTDLALVVRETIQPSHVSLWLRSDR